MNPDETERACLYRRTTTLQLQPMRLISRINTKKLLPPAARCVARYKARSTTALGIWDDGILYLCLSAQREACESRLSSFKKRVRAGGEEKLRRTRFDPVPLRLRADHLTLEPTTNQEGTPDCLVQIQSRADGTSLGKTLSSSQWRQAADWLLGE
jgi:hypothetical protein